jgi:type 1 glutamine amidotransferase
MPLLLLACKSSETAAPGVPRGDAGLTKRALVYHQCNPDIYCHEPASYTRDGGVPTGVQALIDIGAAEGIAVDATFDPSPFTDSNLAGYDLVVFFSVGVENDFHRPFDPAGAPQSPNYKVSFMSGDQKAAFERYVMRGGPFFGIHHSSDGDYFWPFYVDMMGAMFTDHAAPGTTQTATVHVEDPAHPATAPLPSAWSPAGEWYNFDRNPRDVARVLLTVDESTYPFGPKWCVQDHPIAWCRLYKGARVLYTALGHDGTLYADPLFRAHLRGAMRWTIGLDDGDCTPQPAPADLPAGNASCAGAPCFSACRCSMGDAGAACNEITGHEKPPPPTNCGTMVCGAGCSCADATKSACACP